MVASNLERISALNQGELRKDMPHLDVGDTVKMKIKVKEGDKSRLHLFEGTIIAINGVGITKAFTVRKISFGEGVERVFPVNSPVIEKIEVTSKGVISRAKIYYLRNRTGKSARVKVDQENKPKKV